MAFGFSLGPILNYPLGQGWSVGCPEMTCTYDFDEGGWSSMPVGGKVSKLGKVPTQLSLQYEHDFAAGRGDPEDTIRFALKFLFPKL